MMFELPDRIFEEEMRCLLVGLNEFHFYSKDEIGQGQIGYRCNEDFVKIEDWIGDSYFVIGYESLLGDLIVVDVSNEQLPIYSVVGDDWSIVYPLANSIEDYRKILRRIMDSDLREYGEVEKILLEIQVLNKDLKMDYWEDLLLGGYEEVSILSEEKDCT